MSSRHCGPHSTFLLLMLAVTPLLAVNVAARHRPAADKVESFGNGVFIPAFFFVTGLPFGARRAAR